MTLTVDSLVLSSEHPNSVGKVLRVNQSGDLTIEWNTPPSSTLPYGHINTEFWPASDVHMLTAAENK